MLTPRLHLLADQTSHPIMWNRALGLKLNGRLTNYVAVLSLPPMLNQLVVQQKSNIVDQKQELDGSIEKETRGITLFFSYGSTI